MTQFFVISTNQSCYQLLLITYKFGSPEITALKALEKNVVIAGTGIRVSYPLNSEHKGKNG